MATKDQDAVSMGAKSVDSFTRRAEERGAWGSQLEFILTCVGYAVGLGNVWRFPYLAFANGGGAFLVPYILMLLFCGIPVFFFELCFGQFASLGPLAIWAINPMFKGIGMAMIMVSIMVFLSYNILLAYILYFFFASMTDELPWTYCNNAWNTYQCLTTDEVQNKTYLEWYLAENDMNREDLKTPSEEYFYNEVLQMSDSIDDMGGVVWQLALCLLIAWLTVFTVLIKGISSLGKVVYFTSTFPYLMMTVMVIRGCTLEGASEGIEYYLIPEWEKLKDAQVWSDAASQIFYSLSTCSGGLIAMASYNNFHNNVLRDSLTVPFINCATSIFAGFSIFSVLGFMAHQKGVDVADVAESGPGLVFVVYPEGLSQMPAAPVWSVLFFFMMLTLGFSSAFSMVEAVFVAIMDEFPSQLRTTQTRQVLFRGVMCSIFFLISLPMVTQGGFYLFNIIDSYAGGFPRLFTGIFELIAVIWFYGLSRFCEDVCMMIGKKPNIFFKAMWSVGSPILIGGIIVSKAIQHELLEFNGVPYPDWTDVLGWSLVGFIVCWVPIFAVGRWLYDGGYQAIKTSLTPLSSWGPAKPENRTGVYLKVDSTDYSRTSGEIVIGRSGPEAKTTTYRPNETIEQRGIFKTSDTNHTNVDSTEKTK